eukprot:scaffold1356_cov123-Cylindrotheca_fusiformis.AAC.15
MDWQHLTVPVVLRLTCPCQENWRYSFKLTSSSSLNVRRQDTVEIQIVCGSSAESATVQQLQKGYHSPETRAIQQSFNLQELGVVNRM